MNSFAIKETKNIDFEFFSTNKNFVLFFIADWMYKLSCIPDMITAKHLLVAYKKVKCTNILKK